MDNSKLNKTQTEKLKKTLIVNITSDFNIPYCLWSRLTIQNLILTIWEISIPLRTTTDYIKRLNFTPQKPIKHAYQQNLGSIKSWIQVTFSEIKERAKKEKAEIHWLDETGIFSNSNYIRGFSPKGKIPEIKMKISRNMPR